MPLSPGSSHLRVPRDWRKNQEYRRRLYERAGADPQLQRALRAACRADFLFFVNAFGWQYNPKKPPGLEVGPFTTWAVQEKLARKVFEKVEAQKDLVVEKCREMGVSWELLFIGAWLWLFHDWQTVTCVSRNEDYVTDRVLPHSLFWKIDFILDHLPPWLMPLGLTLDQLRKERRGRDYLVQTNIYVNPENNSVISGEASTGDVGVGGRCSLMLVDEYSAIKADFKLLKRSAAVAKCRVFNSTHDGMHTAFYKLIYGDGSTTEVHRVHWTDHPEKAAGLYRFDPVARRVEYLDHDYAYPADYEFVREPLPAGGYAPGVRSPWYDRECREKYKNDPRQIAEELDIDPRGATKQFFDPNVVHARILRDAREPVWAGEVDCDPDTGEFRALRKVNNGSLRLWFDPDRHGGPQKREADHVLRYAVGVDPSYGAGATPTCAAVIDSLGRWVGEWSSAGEAGKPLNFAPTLVAICRYFRGDDDDGAFLAWEIPGPGYELGDRVMKLGYRRVYWRKKNERGVYTQEDTDRPGWYNGGDAQAGPLLAAFSEALALNWLLCPSKYALDECLSFEYTPRGIKHSGAKSDDDPSGAGKNHGDVVVAGALAWLGIAKSVRPAGLRQAALPAAAEEGPRPGTFAWRVRLAEEAAAESADWGLARPSALVRSWG